MTALHYAIKNMNLDIVKYLVESDANLFIRDYKMRAPFDLLNSMIYNKK